MKQVIITCDPGASGAIAWKGISGSDAVQYFAYTAAMPETRRDCIELLREIESRSEKTPVLYIEKVANFIPDGGASAMFEFGRNVERIGCIAETLGMRIVEVPPKVWQKHFSFGTVGTERAARDMSADEKKALRARNAELKRDWKNKLKAEAQRRFPGIKVTLGNADALLLLEYAMSQEASK